MSLERWLAQNEAAVGVLEGKYKKRPVAQRDFVMNYSCGRLATDRYLIEDGL